MDGKNGLFSQPFYGGDQARGVLVTSLNLTVVMASVGGVAGGRGLCLVIRLDVIWL